jgi:carbamoyl-phosphate synthase small subunit
MSEFVAGKLVLADGTTFDGLLLNGLEGHGEVVFNTGMTGYQEVLTDPSYAGQIVTMTYPLIGNYGVNPKFDQARKSLCAGSSPPSCAPNPSNWCEEGSIVCYLEERNIPCLCDVDTRAVTRKIRSHGAMQGRIVRAERDTAQVVAEIASHHAVTLVAEVTTPEIYRIPHEGPAPHVVVMDFGIKRNILRSLSLYGCDLTVVPASTDAATILALKPDGIFLSNGPGDPKAVTYAIETIRQVARQKTDVRHLSGTSATGNCAGRRYFQTEIRPSRREPSGERPQP